MSIKFTHIYQPNDIVITNMKDKELHNIKEILSRNSFFRVFNDEGGEEKSITTREAGDIFGEYSLLTGEKHFATMTALTQLFLYEIKDKDIRPIIEHRSSIIKYLSKSLAERRGTKKYFVHLAKKRKPPILEEALLSKNIFDDINDFFSSIFS